MELPPLDDWEGAHEIADALLVAGPAQYGAMGEGPLSWQEIDAWANRTEAHLSPGDLEDLKRLSDEFFTACGEYREKAVPSPYGGIRQDPAKVSDMLKRALDGLVASNGNRRPPTRKGRSHG